MLLHGTEMATLEQREKWGFQTRFRVIPRDFTKLRTGENVVEIEEIVVATNALSFDEYTECRTVGFLAFVINNVGFRALLRFLIQHDFQILEMVTRMLDAIYGPAAGHETLAPAKLVSLIHEFERETREELWDRPEDLEAFFKDDANFQGLVEGRLGANLMQTYRARAFADCFVDIVSCAVAHAREMLRERGAAPETFELLDEAERFTKGRTHNLLGCDRRAVVPEAELSHDFVAWMGDPDGRPLAEYRWDEPRTIRFPVTPEQYRLVEDGLDHFGHNDLGRGKLLIRLNQNVLWRTPETGPEVSLAHVPD